MSTRPRELVEYLDRRGRSPSKEDGETVVVLLCGGDKASQHVDIEKAKRNWADYWS